MGIISAGEENPYGHPSLALLERLESAGVRILRTDHDGAIRVVTDGERIDVTCFVARPEAAPREALRQWHSQAPDHDQQGQQQ
jgi:beta-lactamase superfamily II metal-dependent hydrolase